MLTNTMFTIDITDKVISDLEEMLLLEGENFTAGFGKDINFIPRIKGGRTDWTTGGTPFQLPTTEEESTTA